MIFDDDYYQETRYVARLPIPPQDTEHDVSFLWHRAREDYGRGHREIGLGSFKEPGERIYIHAKAVYSLPRIVLTVAFTPSVQSDLGEEIGHVQEVKQQGYDRHEVASLQAWYYERKRVLMLWEVDVRHHCREADDPAKDFLLSTLWHYFEQNLLAEFPDCRAILTPGWEPSYDGAPFRAFLQERGYSPHVENTFRKAIDRQRAEA